MGTLMISTYVKTGIRWGWGYLLAMSSQTRCREFDVLVRWWRMFRDVGNAGRGPLGGLDRVFVETALLGLLGTRDSGMAFWARWSDLAGGYDMGLLVGWTIIDKERLDSMVLLAIVFVKSGAGMRLAAGVAVGSVGRFFAEVEGRTSARLVIQGTRLWLGQTSLVTGKVWLSWQTWRKALCWRRRGQRVPTFDLT
jgi:hypothetical protein